MSKPPGTEEPLALPDATAPRTLAQPREERDSGRPEIRFRNPVLAQNCPDPCVLRLGDRYYLYCTSGRAAAAFPIRVSEDLVRWQPAGHIFPARKRPAWTRTDFWAPEVHRVGRRFVAYYTARDRTGRLCLGAAWSASPAGPWTDLGEPLLRDDHVGMIDSHCFQDRDGRRYLYWKSDGNDLRPMERTHIYVQELSADGLALKGSPTPVLENDRPWEGDLVEGPWVARRGRYYYLFYSGNAYWNASYAVGVARSTSPLGPFAKKEETLLRRDEQWMGPGHGSLVRAHDGRDYYVYHAWIRGRVGGKNPRMLLMDRVHWEDGWPRINDGSPSNLPQG
jgi:arabinan endo-1,5-alpha-L-arabinosidase